MTADAATTLSTTALEAAREAEIVTENECDRCEGCGKIADSEQGEPWTAWLQVPLQSSVSVLAGLVKPIPCPECRGTGRKAVQEATKALGQQLVVVCASGEWCGHARDLDHAERLRIMFDADEAPCGPHRAETWTQADADEALEVHHARVSR